MASNHQRKRELGLSTRMKIQPRPRLGELRRARRALAAGHVLGAAHDLADDVVRDRLLRVVDPLLGRADQVLVLERVLEPQLVVARRAVQDASAAGIGALNARSISRSVRNGTHFARPIENAIQSYGETGAAPLDVDISRRSTGWDLRLFACALSSERERGGSMRRPKNVCDATSSRMRRYLVTAKNGAVVRVDCSLDSPLRCEIAAGQRSATRTGPRGPRALSRLRTRAHRRARLRLGEPQGAHLRRRDRRRRPLAAERRWRRRAGESL